jgi:hypothetical protein
MQMSENHIAESDIKIRFFIRLISVPIAIVGRVPFLCFNVKIRHYLHSFT